MRQSPLAVWGYALPPEQLDEYVRADTRLTHFNQVCEDASSAFIAALGCGHKRRPRRQRRVPGGLSVG